VCGELRPHARTLVDGFGIPEAWLACPLLDGERDPAAAVTDPIPPTEEPSDLAAVG
jgi:acyl-CoA oxidase